ncbi:hypothetical protein LCGC14_0405020 [marine sediment metagenome]|uniref:Uncharacterized protein n=1 Tax=marine sediment metagenome TaxID=412755 RepID=A0A0F9W4I3_9ZZZZ
MSTPLGISASNVESTIGDASGIYNNPAFAVTDAGQTLDISTLTLNNSSSLTRHISLINIGANPVRVAFGSDGTAITFVDLPGNSWNAELSDSAGLFSQLSIDGNTNKIGFRCSAALTTTVYILLT